MRTKLEPITVQSGLYGAPGQFFWQGRRYHIDVIERIWRNPHGRWSGQRIYRVRSQGKRFTLHYDQRLKRWHMMRAPWRIRLGLAVERLATRFVN